MKKLLLCMGDITIGILIIVGSLLFASLGFNLIYNMCTFISQNIICIDLVMKFIGNHTITLLRNYNINVKKMVSS